jgi:hypothetical protein
MSSIEAIQRSHRASAERVVPCLGVRRDRPAYLLREARQAIREGGLVSNIVQAWLLREAAEAQLEQARYSLKLALGAQARVQHIGGSVQPMAMAELARSLYTDRANLTRVAKTAESDERIRPVLDYAASGERSLLLSSQD